MGEPPRSKENLVQSLERITKQVGPPIEVFKPSLASRIAGIILGLLAGGAGIALITAGLWAVFIRVPQPDDASPWSILVIWGAGGFGSVTIGVVFISTSRYLRSLRVLLCPGGFIWIHEGKADAFAWDVIAQVQEVVTEEYFPLRGIFKYALPMGASRRYVVCRDDGLQFNFDSDVVEDARELARIIQTETQSRGVPWNVTSH